MYTLHVKEVEVDMNKKSNVSLICRSVKLKFCYQDSNQIKIFINLEIIKEEDNIYNLLKITYCS